MAVRKRIARLAPALLVLLAPLFFSAAPSAAAEDKVIAYYFHGDFRCPTCRTLEQYSREAVEGNFKDEIAAGALEFRSVNVDRKENAHFVEDYGLYTKSLVLSKREDGRETKHKNLEKIWDYARDRVKFIGYVTAETRAYLEE